MVFNFFKWILILGAIFIGFKLFFPSQFDTMYARFFPCTQPVSYSVGTFHEEFGISEQNFLKALAEAEEIWEDSIGRNLFDHSTEGTLKVNLIYDYRQEATDEITELSEAEKETYAEYNALKAEYNAKQREYSKDRNAYLVKVRRYESRQAEYNKQVNYWNSQGGAPESEYNKLNQEAMALAAEAEEIRDLERGINRRVDEINSLVSRVNTLARELNLNVAILNNINATRGEEFTQGEYRVMHGRQEIDIYEFSNTDRLVRLVAHEFGHALGLEHVDDKDAIMYYLNDSTNNRATAADVSMLKNRCKIN